MLVLPPEDTRHADSAPTVLVVDYGGVLGDHHLRPAETELAELIGVSRARCRELVTERSIQGEAFREDRISESEFWECVFREANADRRSGPPDHVLSELWARTYRVNPTVGGLLQRVRRSCPVGILSNIDRARASYLVERVRVMDLVDFFLPSFGFGAIKPKRQLWEQADAAVQARYGPGTDVLYIDDRTTHVLACEVVGWRGYLYESSRQLAATLADLGYLRGQGAARTAEDC